MDHGHFIQNKTNFWMCQIKAIRNEYTIKNADELDAYQNAQNAQEKIKFLFTANQC